MPKRKTEDSTTRQARKRVASTAPKDTGTKATSTTLPQPDVELANMPCSIERNTTTFPLFRLLLEIREKIYGLLNSNELWNPDLREDRFSLLVCNQQGPANEDEAYLLGVPRADTFSYNWEYTKHELGFGFGSPDTDPTFVAGHVKEGSISHREMHLKILRTCRQMFAEANRILWATNTFSFNDPASFKRFMETRKPFHTQNMRKLRLVMDWTSDGHRAWTVALHMSHLNSLQGLQDLRLVINNDISEAGKATFEANSGLEALLEHRFHESILKLSTLPLTKAQVQVVIAELRAFRAPDIRDCVWAKDQRRSYAAIFRERLLTPQAAQLYGQVLQKWIEGCFCVE